STCDTTVTVQDTTPPVASCQTFIATLDGSGSVTVNATDIDNGSTDNCAITVREISKDAGATYGLSVNFTCANAGANAVKLRVRDAAGNSSTCDTTVTVQDTTPPVASCQTFIATLDG